MLIVNKDGTDVYNIDHVVNIYIGSDGTSIKVSAGTATRGGILGKYRSYEETKEALKILLTNISSGEKKIVNMPQDETVSEKTKIKETYHHISGKKIKGHGGS